jgi:Arc/MetJ-type ribon-helix-helix transcriptional regulator
VINVGETLVRFEGAQELIIERLVGLGLFKTKSEVIRAGILELGKEYKVIGEIKEIEDELAVKKMQKISNEINEGKRKVFTEEEVKKKYGFK